jgi:hypothetical protein
MAKISKELALLSYGAATGIALFLVSTLLVNNRGFGGFTAWGYPFVWRSVLSASPLFVNWFALGVDFVFWLALSLAVVEGLSHNPVPYVKKKLKILRSRQGRVSTPWSTPDGVPASSR